MSVILSPVVSNPKLDDRTSLDSILNQFELVWTRFNNFFPFWLKTALNVCNTEYKKLSEGGNTQ